ARASGDTGVRVGAVQRYDGRPRRRQCWSDRSAALMPPGLSAADFWYILPEMVLTVGAMLVLLADVYVARDRRGLVVGLSVVVLAATGVAVGIVGNPHVKISHGLMSIDAFGLFFKILFLGAAALTLLMSGPYLTVEGTPVGAYCFLVL